MAVRLTQLGYNAGEIGELMYGRADDPKYSVGLALCRNAFVTPQGPLKNRAGFQYVNAVKDASKPVRLIPFSYSATQTMVIELGDEYARFHSHGQTLLDEDGDPYEIETPWAAEDLFAIHFVQNADIVTLVHPSYPPYEIRRYGETDWRCEKVNLLSSLDPPISVVAVVASEASNDDNKDKYTQSYKVTALNSDRTIESEASVAADVVANLYATGTTVRVSWQAVPGASWYRVYKLQGGIYGYIGETQALSILDDNIAPETGQTPPYVDDVFGVSKGIASVTVNSGGSGYEYSNAGIADVSSGSLYWQDLDGNASQDASGYLYVESSEDGQGSTYPTAKYPEVRCSVTDSTGTGATVTLQTTTSYTNVVEDGVYRTYSRRTITGITVTARGDNYKLPQLKVEYRGQTGSGWTDWKSAGWCRLSVSAGGPAITVTDSTGTGATFSAVVADGAITAVQVLTPGKNYTNPTLHIQTISGSGASLTPVIADNTGDYPAAVGYFEQRRIFAGTPKKPQQVWMTATGTGDQMIYHLPVQDTDRISFAVASQDLNQIQHVVALQQLILLTSSAEWRVSPLNSDAITPESISVRPQSYIGASVVQPYVVNSNIIYVAARGSHVRELAYNYQAGGYITGDISIRAPHLFDGYTISDMAYMKSPDPYLYFTRSDGVLLGFCYVPEQSVGAWCSFETEGKFESAAVVQEGDYDYLYCVVQRTINGAACRYVERMEIRNDEAPGSGLFLDCAGHYEGDATATVSGLTWLKNTTVTVVADGAVIRDVQVDANGGLTLPQAASNIWAGLPYETVVRTLPVSVSGAQDGSYGRSHVKNINRVYLRLFRTTGIEAGPTEDALRPLKVRRTEAYGEPPSFRSGEMELPVDGTWQADGVFVVRQKEPAPFTLICHTAEVELGG